MVNADIMKQFLLQMRMSRFVRAYNKMTLCQIWSSGWWHKCCILTFGPSKHAITK